LNSKREYLKNHAFSNYFKFCKTTLKTPKTNFAQLDKLYTFAIRRNPKMCLDFEMGFSRANLNAKFRVFGNSNQNKSLNLIQTIQFNTYNIKVNLF